MKGHVIGDAKRGKGKPHSFDRLFAKVAPYLRNADLTIGNLETTFGGAKRYERRSPVTGFPMFSCPDQLAPALRRAGFDVVSTANNHCMDTGSEGLVRTLNLLDQHGIKHTGTYRSLQESQRYLIMTVNQIRIGILSYTMGTNRIPVPAGKPWMVNFNRQAKMLRDLRYLKPRTDAIIVCIHFGKEFKDKPTATQKRQVNLLLNNGATIVLGAHPHVPQPMVKPGMRKLAIYSLGNFVSPRLFNIPKTQTGLILRMTLKKAADGKTSISNVNYIPTWVSRKKQGVGHLTEIIPNYPDATSSPIRRRMRKHVDNILKARV